MIRLTCPDPVKPELRAVLPALGEILKAANLEFYITRLSYLAFSGHTEERAAMLFRCVALPPPRFLIRDIEDGSGRANEMREGSRTSAQSSDRRISTATCDDNAFRKSL